MYNSNVRKPVLTGIENFRENRKDAISFTRFSRNVLLLLLIIIPTLTYFDDYELFPFFGIDINVRFLLLLAISFSVLLVFLAIRTVRTPRIINILLFFAFLGVSVAVIQGIPIRWWLPPFLRLIISGLIVIAGYNLTLLGYFNRRIFHWGVIFALTIPLLYGFYQAAQGLAPLLNGAFRISSTFYRSPVGYALFLAGMGLLLVSKKKISILTLIYLGAVAVMILSTHSRQATVAFLISLIILSYLQKRMKLILLAIVVISPVLIFSSTLINQFLYRLQLFTTINSSVINQVMSNPKDSIWVLAGVDNSALLRIHTFVVGWDLFKVSPLFGRGLGSFVMNYEQITGLSNLPAHNDYLMYLVETGLIGLVLYLGLQFLILHSLLKRRAQLSIETRFFAYSVAIAYFAINVLSFLSNPYYFYEIQFWIWLGVGIAIGLIQSENTKSQVVHVGIVPGDEPINA